MAKQPQFPRKSPSRDDASAKKRVRKRSVDVTSQLDRTETVSGRWLVKAMLATLVVAGVALYLTICLLFYQGQWQFVFFPPNGAAQRRALSGGTFSGSWARRTGPAPRTSPPSAAAIAAATGLPIRDHHFDYTEEGVARLDGWWIPAANETHMPGSNLSSMVLFFCPDGRSNLPDNVAAFRAFHELGISVFAFDYRGFGASQPTHPSQQKAYEDGVAALHYLTDTRHIDPSRIVIYGAEVGSAVATRVAVQSPQIAGLILENPQPSLARQVRREQHIHVLPMWLIFTDRFDISRMMPSLKMPKLVIATPAQPEYEAGAAMVYDEAAAPKQKVQVDLPAPLYSQPTWRQAMESFLNLVSARSH